MNTRQSKKAELSLHIEVQQYLRANGTYPWDIFPHGSAVKWFPRSARWRAEMRKLGASVAAGAHTFHDFTCPPMKGCEGRTWKQWCAMLKAHRMPKNRS